MQTMKLYYVGKPMFPFSKGKAFNAEVSRAGIVRFLLSGARWKVTAKKVTIFYADVASVLSDWRAA